MAPFGPSERPSDARQSVFALHSDSETFKGFLEINFVLLPPRHS